MANTGNVVFLTLEEYYVNGPEAGQATGFTKANITSDPDYVGPVPDSEVPGISCPIDDPTTTFNFFFSTNNSTTITASSPPEDVSISIQSDGNWTVNLESPFGYDAEFFGSATNNNLGTSVSGSGNASLIVRIQSFNNANDIKISNNINTDLLTIQNLE